MDKGVGFNLIMYKVKEGCLAILLTTNTKTGCDIDV